MRDLAAARLPLLRHRPLRPDLASGEGDARRGRMLLGSVLFVLGFALVFVAIGSVTGALGDCSWASSSADSSATAAA